MAHQDPNAEARPPLTAVEDDVESSSDARDLELITQLLVGMSREELLELRDRFESPDQFVSHLAAAIDQEVARHEEPGRSFSAAMQPIVSRGVIDTVEQDPGSFGRAIAPVMGPALRQSVRQTLQDFVASMERTAQASFTIKGLRWRLEAMRTGRSVAEVALMHSLLYRVEHVFLVERDSGILLHHESFDSDHEAREPELVSAMLTAIRSFAVDAFEADRDDGLDSFEVGDLTIWVENSERLVLAAVVRGQPTPEVRDRLEDAVGELEVRFGNRLDDFDGDVAPFARAAPTMRSCLSERRQGEDNEESGARSLWLLGAMAGLVVVGILALTIWGLLLGRRYDRLLAELGDTPGIVVTEASRSFRKLRVEGLHDPLAERPEAFRERAGLSADQVPMIFEPYSSNQADLVLKRATIRLAPPEGVALALDQGRLVVGGAIPASWLAQAERIWPSVAGISQLQVEGRVVPAPSRVESVGIGFPYDESTIEPASGAAIGRLRDLLAAMPYDRVSVWGYSGERPSVLDPDLAQARLAAVVALLPEDVDSDLFEVRGVRPGNVACGEGCELRAGVLFEIEAASVEATDTP